MAGPYLKTIPPLNRNDSILDGLLHGETGLWAAVLLDILNEIEAPADRPGHDRAIRIVMEPETGSLPIIASALGIETVELQKMIIRRLKRRGMK